MHEEYKESARKITVPSHLLESTSQQMNDALGCPPEEIVVRPLDGNRKKLKKGRIISLSFGILAVAAAALFAFVPTFRGYNSEIVTPLVSGEHQPTVALKSGDLHFAQEDSLSIDLSPGYGLLPNWKQWTIEEYENYLGDRSLPQKEISGFDLTEETLHVLGTDGTVGSDKFIRTYRGDKDSSLVVVLSHSGSAFSFKEKPNSTIGDTPLFLRWTDEKDSYTAIFYDDDFSYEIVANGVSQEDFINVILEFLN